VIETPHDQPVLRIRTRIAYAHGERLRTGGDSRDSASVAAGTCEPPTAETLQEASRYEALVQEPKYLLFYAQEQQNGYGIVREGQQHGCLLGDEQTRAARNSPLARSYGLSEANRLGRPPWKSTAQGGIVVTATSVAP
jgi:hypothetical protein